MIYDDDGIWIYVYYMRLHMYVHTHAIEICVYDRTTNKV